MKRQSRQARNLLDLVPVRNVKWERDENGLVALMIPRFRNPVAARLLSPWMKRAEFKVRLDQTGSFVWLACDGTKTVSRVAQEVQNRFGEEMTPLCERLGIFLRRLRREGFIDLEEPRNGPA